MLLAVVLKECTSVSINDAHIYLPSAQINVAVNLMTYVLLTVLIHTHSDIYTLSA